MPMPMLCSCTKKVLKVVFVMDTMIFAGLLLGYICAGIPFVSKGTDFVKLSISFQHEVLVLAWG